MSVLAELLDLILYLSFLKVREEDIEKNLRYLKKYTWFQNYLQDRTYKALIIYDPHVRKVIGKFKSKKFTSDSYQIRCQRKLHNILVKREIYQN